LQLRRGAGVQKFATARWLVNGCQSTPTVHIRKLKPSASAKPKVRNNRKNPLCRPGVNASKTVFKAGFAPSFCCNSSGIMNSAVFLKLTFKPLFPLQWQDWRLPLRVISGSTRRYSVAGSPPSGRQTASWAMRRRKNSRSARAVVKRRASRQARSAAACRPRRKWSSPITVCQPG
jgi:hypothetical protein